VTGESPVKILLIEDDGETADYVTRGLREQGHVVDHTSNGRDGLFRAGDGNYDVLIVDRMLPGIEGLGLVRMLRDANVRTPVLFLTALGGVGDRVRGLEAGGDDYLAKPFHLQEFLLRVRAILRRWDWYRASARSQGSDVLRFAGNEVDFRAFRGRSWNGEAQELTEKEAMILKVLAEKSGEIVSREDLLEKVWGYDVFPSTRTVDNFILRLRKRFERDPANPVHFLTVWGVGYRFFAGEGS